MSQPVETTARARARASARDFLSPSAAARYAGVTQPTMLRWCQSGVLPAKKIVGRWRIDPRDLDRLLEGEA